MNNSSNGRLDENPVTYETRSSQKRIYEYLRVYDVLSIHRNIEVNSIPVLVIGTEQKP